MASTTSNTAFSNAYKSVQANNINGSVHISTGKSTIARTVARSYYDKQRLAASFFFSRGGGDAGHAGKFVTSIAVQLARNVPALKQRISDAVVERDDIASQSLRDQWQHLALRPLSKLGDSDCPASLVLVVDALDECDNDSHIRIIVQLLAEVRSSLTGARLRVLLTSRPEVPIRHGFGKIADSEHKDVVLHNISASIINHDIGLFLQHYLRIIAEECNQADGWPGVETIRHSSIDSSSANDSSSSDSSTDKHFEILPEQRLDSIYLTVLRSPVRRYRKQERKR
ncbi:hypothetical protein COCHEDRAFT_1210544 [Bipolaris maydis C5]|uniref:Nephrocystin 3-like N-terminal domain-containing protein n=1 Tax=Cochliobolus heterostrophus (strain C5 / ATCC 48332 / race O) TaxID=701091 RepID=M2US05_COCH5|nr:hypothetical protein COCHEDRAFT_1220020 [Bipolaris maydis C5]EMD96341.1 hypothetical protein COCHEDRAFT_1210544 [Bipolaris maydis C5]KAJ6274178.1 hypothetical protein PSV08DRAFT_346901 [Bipolaris maydis]